MVPGSAEHIRGMFPILDIPLEGLHGVPVNSERNRMAMAAAYADAGTTGMTPVMCGFFLQALALDRASDLHRKVHSAARRVYATYNEEGMVIPLALAVTMRLRLVNPNLFNELPSE